MADRECAVSVAELEYDQSQERVTPEERAEFHCDDEPYAQ